MNSRLLAGMLLSCLGLAACDGAAPAGSTASSTSALPPSALDAGDRIAWQAELACADCDAIETRLQLRRDGDARNYVLTEVYLAADGDARFAEHGQWQQRDALLHLQGDQGTQRAYGLLPDGRLQPLDRHGRALSRDGSDLLLPAGTAQAP